MALSRFELRDDSDLKGIIGEVVVPGGGDEFGSGDGRLSGAKGSIVGSGIASFFGSLIRAGERGWGMRPILVVSILIGGSALVREYIRDLRNWHGCGTGFPKKNLTFR